MTNTALLKAAIQKSGLKYKYLAEQLGLSTYGLQKKVENATEFKASEITPLRFHHLPRGVVGCY